MSPPGPPLPLRGTLTRKGYVALLSRLHSAGEAGVLEVRHGRQLRRIYFLGGCPLWCESGPGPEDVGDALVGAGRLAPSQVAELRLGLAPGLSLADAVVDAGLITRDALESAVRVAIERGLAAPLGWQRPSWGFDRRNALPVHLLEWLSLGLGDPLLHIWPSVRTSVPVEEALALLQDESGGRLLPTPDLRPRIGQWPPESPLNTIAATLDGGQSLDDLFRRIPDRSGQLALSLWFLVVSGLVERDRCPPWTDWVAEDGGHAPTAAPPPVPQIGLARASSPAAPLPVRAPGSATAASAPAAAPPPTSRPASVAPAASTVPSPPASRPFAPPSASDPLQTEPIGARSAPGPVPVAPSSTPAAPLPPRPSSQAPRASTPAGRSLVASAAFVPPPVVRLSSPGAPSPTARKSDPGVDSDGVVPPRIPVHASAVASTSSPAASSPAAPTQGFGRSLAERTGSVPTLRPPNRMRSTGTHPGVRTPTAPGAALERVRTAHSQRGHHHYYAFLGIAPDAPRAALENACNALAAVWNEAASDPGADDVLREQARDLLADTHLVWRTLGDDQRRAEYDRRMARGTAPVLQAVRAPSRPLTQPGLPSVPPDGAAPERRAPLAPFLQAKKLMEQGEYLSAWPLLQRTRLEQPANADVLAEIGWCAFQLRGRGLDDGDTPEEYLQLAVTFAPQHGRALEYLCRVALTRGDQSLARKRLRSFLLVEPESHWARNALADLREEEGDPATLPSRSRRL